MCLALFHQVEGSPLDIIERFWGFCDEVYLEEIEVIRRKIEDRRRILWIQFIEK